MGFNKRIFFKDNIEISHLLLELDDSDRLRAFLSSFLSSFSLLLSTIFVLIFFNDLRMNYDVFPIDFQLVNADLILNDEFS